MRKIIFIFFLVINLHCNYAFASTKDVKEFVQKITDITIATVSSNEVSEEEKEIILNDLFMKSVDINWMGRFAVGVYWREASEQVRNNYLELYKKFLISSYVPKFREYTGQKMDILEVTEEEKDDYLVNTIIYQENEAPVRIDYKIRLENNSYKIYDVAAEAISLITTQRSDFGSILSRGGLKALNERLSKKLNLLQK